MSAVTRLAKEMSQLQETRDETKRMLDILNKRLDAIRLKELPDAMVDEELTCVTIDGVGRVQLASDCYARILDKDKGYAWLKEHGYEGLIQPYIQPSSFKAVAKQTMVSGDGLPEDLFSITPFTRASIVKIK